MFPLEPLHPFVLPVIQILCTRALFLFSSGSQEREQTNLSSQAIIFLIDIHLPPILSYTQLFLL